MERNEQLEGQVIELIAADRIYIPISSLDGKLKRMKPKIAKSIEIPKGNKYNGERVYARIEENDVTAKARTMREAINLFGQQYPKYGKILEEMIEEERNARETNLYFGINEGCRLTADDYLGTMQDVGFTEAGAKNLYPELMEVSRKISRKRDEERSILLGTTLG